MYRMSWLALVVLVPISSGAVEIYDRWLREGAADSRLVKTAVYPEYFRHSQMSAGDARSQYFFEVLREGNSAPREAD